jgi:glutamate N-acetyltransferase/amino-acid N-acetyltransferase
MAVNVPPLQELLVVPGVSLGTAGAAIKRQGRDDIAVVLLHPQTRAAGVFTRSSFRAAPVILADRRLTDGRVRALVINSGNANAATGDPGLADAVAVCDAVAAALDVPGDSVLPFSTGVIGERLPVSRMLPAVASACGSLAPDGWEAAARAIMTTDTAPKAVSRRVRVAGKEVVITGIAKGAGMIKPDMATMLGFVCCDAAVADGCLPAMVKEVADRSFNRITVDGDTSTNDAFVVCATGCAENAPVTDVGSEGYAELRDGLAAVATELAQSIVRDGEGATRFVTVRVSGGESSAECLKVAYTVAESPLVKTAIFAGDPNWGRFCMAIGRAGIADLDTSRVAVYLDDVPIALGGLVAPQYEEAAAAGVMARQEFEVHVDLGRGSAEETVWTTDLSYEYVRINAEYRT